MSPAHYGKFVAYFRVSTDRQGKSGLGLEAQRKSVLDFLDGGRWSLVAEFTEVESGKRSDRPQLAKALDALPAAESQAGHRQAGPAQPQLGIHRHADGVRRRVCGGR